MSRIQHKIISVTSENANTQLPASDTAETEDAHDCAGASDNETSSGEDDDNSFGVCEKELPPEWHDNHWDKVVEYESPWQGWVEAETNWPSSHLDLHDRSIPNDALYKDPFTQQWLSKLSTLQPQDFQNLALAQSGWNDIVIPKIPLFKHEAGDEYQMKVVLYPRAPYVSCPAVPDVPWQDRANLVAQVRYRLPLPEHTSLNTPSYPRYVISLTVRTTTRYPEHRKSKEPVTERTDYEVVVDIEHQDMPLWILCAQRTLREHVEDEGWFVPHLPIFKGLMQQDEGLGYDIACILDSIRRLGVQEPGQPTFEEACDLVGRTRAVGDPGYLYVSKAKDQEIANEMEIRSGK